MKDLNIILASLPEIKDLEFKTVIESHAKNLLNDGWSIPDIVSYISCMEEINPDLDEDIAVSRMVAIRNKYPDNKAAINLVVRTVVNSLYSYGYSSSMVISNWNNSPQNITVNNNEINFSIGDKKYKVTVNES